MDIYDTPDQPGSLKWFPWLVLCAQILGLGSVILVAVWLGQYRGGFAWQSDVSKEFNYHPLFMVLGMIFLYGDAILVYRVFRNGRKTYIKILHAIMMLLSLIFSSVGLKAVFDSHNLAEKPIPNMYSLHSWIGLATVLLFALQWIFGFSSFLLPNMSQQWKQNLMPFHVFFGMAIFCLALASSLTGLTEKAFFVLKSNYATSPEGVLINSLGLVLISFVMLIIYIASRSEYKRYPLPEERHIQLSE